MWEQSAWDMFGAGRDSGRINRVGIRDAVKNLLIATAEAMIEVSFNVILCNHVFLGRPNNYNYPMSIFDLGT